MGSRWLIVRYIGAWIAIPKTNSSRKILEILKRHRLRRNSLWSQSRWFKKRMRNHWRKQFRNSKKMRRKRKSQSIFDMIKHLRFLWIEIQCILMYSTKKWLKDSSLNDLTSTNLNNWNRFLFWVKLSKTV